MEKMAKVKVGNAEKAAKVAKVHVIQAWPGLNMPREFSNKNWCLCSRGWQ